VTLMALRTTFEQLGAQVVQAIHDWALSLSLCVCVCVCVYMSLSLP